MNRKGTIGQILTSFPSIIFLLLVILAYILVSSFIVRDSVESYSLADDFLDDYVVYDGELTTVKNIFGTFCSYNYFERTESIVANINNTLNEHFFSKYGDNNYFAFTWKPLLESRIYFSNLDLSEYDIDEDGDLSVTADNGSPKFEAFFNTKSKNVEVRQICGDQTLYIREGQ